MQHYREIQLININEFNWCNYNSQKIMRKKIIYCETKKKKKWKIINQPQTPYLQFVAAGHQFTSGRHVIARICTVSILFNVKSKSMTAPCSNRPINHPTPGAKCPVFFSPPFFCFQYNVPCHVTVETSKNLWNSPSRLSLGSRCICKLKIINKLNKSRRPNVQEMDLLKRAPFWR